MSISIKHFTKLYMYFIIYFLDNPMKSTLILFKFLATKGQVQCPFHSPAQPKADCHAQNGYINLMSQRIDKYPASFTDKGN